MDLSVTQLTSIRNGPEQTALDFTEADPDW